MTIRFSGECPRPRESTAVRLSSPDDLLGHPGVQGRPHVSTAVVSTALAADPLYLVTADLTLPERGVTIAANICPAVIYTRTAACPSAADVPRWCSLVRSRRRR